MYFKQVVSPELYLDTDAASIKHKLDRDAECTATSTEYTERQAASPTIAVDDDLILPISLVPVVKGFWIRAKGAFRLFLNGSADGVEYAPVSETATEGGAAYAVSFQNARATEIRVENMTVGLLKVEYEVWGTLE